MRTDTIFYQLFQTFSTLLFELIGQSPSLAKGYEFTSREIKELARRFDGIFLPKTDYGSKIIYFVEVQFQVKSDFYYRFFTEIFVYLGQYKPKNDWRAVAVFASRSLDPGVPMQYRGLVNAEQVLFVYLDELESPVSPSFGMGIVQLVVENEQAAELQGKQLIEKARQELEDRAFKQKVIEFIETILV